MSKKRNLIFLCLLILGVLLINGCGGLVVPLTYTVTYNGNGNTSGVVPIDANLYEQGALVTVLGKGTLVKTGYTFVCWNTAADGSGTDQAEGSAYIMGASDVTLFAKWTPLYALRDTGPAGGLIFYVKEGGYSDGWMYLEAAPSDQGTGIQWYNGSYMVTGAIGTAIGTGQANTTAIVTIQGAGSYAAQVCNDLTVGGYNEWFLPSKDELNLMYENLYLVVGGFFTDRVYWSSSETTDYYAWYQSFYSGGQYNNWPKSNSARVRAVRAF